MNESEQQLKIVNSVCITLKQLFSENFIVDFYQREYVWERRQLEDLINDLSNAFLKCWREGDKTKDVRNYDPYFMGEIILSKKNNERNAVIDGQQRITTFSLLLIYMYQTYKNVEKFPLVDIQNAIYSDDFGTPCFKLEIDTREKCMLALYNYGRYEPTEKDRMHVQKIVDRYNDISECWNEKINEENVVSFAYWILEKVIFSKVWSNSDEFAYIIFETMNDRGLSLTHVEMLRSYLLANIIERDRKDSLEKFDKTIEKLSTIKLSSKSKAESDFFRVFLRSHYAENLAQGNDTSDFVVIGNAFHRWVRDNEKLLNLKKSEDYIDFINRIEFFADKYALIYKYINSRDTNKYFYLIVNNDYGFTLQTALILAAINFNDSNQIVEEKIQIISKYLTKVLSWRVWNHWMISQSSMEASIYLLCKRIRNMDINDLKKIISNNPIDLPQLKNSPTLNQQNKRRLKTLIAMITEIVARESNSSDYMLNKENIEIEHIWSDHYDQHLDEFNTKDEFDNMRNNIGDLLVLPKSFNASYNDSSYKVKVEQYYSQNILAQTLNKKKYINNPDFMNFLKKSDLKFKPYEEFKKNSIIERSELYKAILLWNWKEI